MNNELLAGLPGEALMRAGLADSLAGRKTVPALLIAIARGRLQRGDAYFRYNALLRELVSFESALERRIRR